MMYSGVTTRNSKKQPLNDKTNVPYTKKSAIKAAEKSQNIMTNLPKQDAQHLGQCKKIEISNQIQEKNSGKKIHLRARKIKNYTDLLRDSIDNNVEKKRVPVYLQNLKPKGNTKSRDPFKFTEDVRKKKTNDDNSDSDSSMHEILSKLTKKEKKTKTLFSKVINEGVKKKMDPNKINKRMESLNKSISTEDSEKLQPSDSNVILNLSSHNNAPSNRINIISDVVIPPLENTLSPIHSSNFSFGDPNDYDDDQDYIIPSTPWRGDVLNLRRNPHWLALKDSSLPFYNQEMILQPNLLEKSATNVSISKEKTYQQMHISDFILHEKDSSIRSDTSSMFDNHNFSPIKNTESPRNVINTSNLFDDNSLSPFKSRNTPTAKRRILSPLNENRSFNNAEQVQNSISFSFMDDQNKENLPKQFKNKNPSALPMRVSITELKKVRKNVLDELIDDQIINATLDQSLSVEESNDIKAPGLFEDLEPPPTVERTYVSKRHKGVRILPVEEEEEFEKKQKKKKKDGRSKAEKQAFDKWAASFNAMCEEVEQHHLEIEPI